MAYCEKLAPMTLACEFIVMLLSCMLVPSPLPTAAVALVFAVASPEVAYTVPPFTVISRP